MNRFTPCLGKTACRDDGRQCLTCKRSLAEIEQTRDLIDSLAEFVCAQGYINANEFTAYVADKVESRLPALAALNRYPYRAQCKHNR